jgi:hypothetical protein
MTDGLRLLVLIVLAPLWVPLLLAGNMIGQPMPFVSMIMHLKYRPTGDPPPWTRKHEQNLDEVDASSEPAMSDESQIPPSADAPMTDVEIAFRAAINVLRDTIESGRTPSGLPLEPDSAELHKQAASYLQILLDRLSAKP